MFTLKACLISSIFISYVILNNISVLLCEFAIFGLHLSNANFRVRKKEYYLELFAKFQFYFVRWESCGYPVTLIKTFFCRLYWQDGTILHSVHIPTLIT